MIKNNIKIKMTVFVCLIIIVVAALQIGMNVAFGKSFYIEQRKSITMQAFNSMAKAEGAEELEQVINNFESTHNLRITIYDSDYQVIYFSRNKFDPKIPWLEKKQTQLDQQTQADQQSQHKSDSSKFELFSKEPTAELRKNFRQPNESLILLGISPDEKRYIEIETYLSSIEQSIRVTNQFSIIIVIVALFVGAILSYIFARSFTKPIKQISDIAGRVSALDFSKKAAVSSKDELGELAQSINVMSDSLEDFVNKLKGMNVKLQSDLEYKEKIEQMRKQFVANVSHELKTPLAMLMSYSEVLKHDYEGIDKEFYYDVIIDEAAKMNTLVNSLLDISSLENGLSSLRKEEINFDKFVESVCAKYTLPFSQKGIIDSLKMDASCEVCVDIVKLEQVIKNYIANAISHTKSGARVKMRTESRQGKAYFYIFNEGTHINSDEQERIWEIFYKSDKARTRTENSTGIGLYVVRTIINAHCGDFGMENIQDGVEFWFCIDCIS